LNTDNKSSVQFEILLNVNSCTSLDKTFEQTIYLIQGKRYPIGDEVRQDLQSKPLMLMTSTLIIEV